jgi:hypothetical protein
MANSLFYITLAHPLWYASVVGNNPYKLLNFFA